MAELPATVAVAAKSGMGMYFRSRHTSNVTLDDEVLRLEKKEPPLSVEIRRVMDEVTKPLAQGEMICIAIMWKPATRSIGAWLSNPKDPKPRGFEAFALEALQVLSDATDRALKIARWRTGERRERSTIRFFNSFHWSVDGQNWQLAPAGLCLNMITAPAVPKEIGSEILESTADLWNSDAGEPLAHELFQEAWSQRASQPTNARSALVMSIAAAETAMKHLIATLVPEARWLAENTQSPPLCKLLKEYLPTLPARLKFKGRVLPPPEWLLETIQKGVTLRNQVVHGRNVEIKQDSLDGILHAVNDVLYLLDVYSGHAWAEERLSVRLRQSIAEELARSSS